VRELAAAVLRRAGMKVLTLDRAASFDAKRNLLIWQIDSMEANERVVLRVKAVSEKASNVVLRAQVNSADEVLLQKQLTVRVTDASDSTETSRR